jgi:hypothetical protein
MFDRAARMYVARGWAVFPVKPRSKEPLLSEGLRGATTDAVQVTEWWTRWPEANVGVVTGPSRLAVIDLDDLDAGYRLSGRGFSLPPTLASKTGKGFHFYYQAPVEPLRPTVGKLPGVGETPGIDLRAGSSYVLAPPSVHPNGLRYRWDTSFAVEPQPAPDWLRPDPPRERADVEVKDPSAYATAALRNVVGRIKEAKSGERNHTLNREVFGLRRFVEAGELNREHVRDACFVAAKLIGLEDDEANKTIASALGEL